jgi:hypothetical protein
VGKLKLSVFVFCFKFLCFELFNRSIALGEKEERKIKKKPL